MISTTPGNPHHGHASAHAHALAHAHATAHAHSHAHPHSLPKPGQLGGPLSLALEKGGSRARMDSQKFLIPSLPVSSRPDPGGQKQRRERSIVNGTACGTSHTPNENGGSMYQSHIGGGGHQYPTNYNGGLRRGSGGYTGLPPPTNSPRKDAHSPMYHHPHPMSANGDLDLLTSSHHKGQYLGQHQHRASVPIPCSSPARAASASPKSASASTISPPTSKSSYPHSASASPQLPGDRERDRDRDCERERDRLYTAGFPHHPNLTGVSSHAAALYAAAAAAQPLPYAALFGGYPHSHAATTYLDNFHSSIMAQAQQQKNIQKSSMASPPEGGSGARRAVPPDVSAYYPNVTATTSFHTKLIDSALPIERLYNGHHHYQQQQQSIANGDRDRDRDRDRERERGHPFPSLPNGVSVSVSKGSPAGSENQNHRVGSMVPNFHSGGPAPAPPGKSYFNANSKLSLSVNGTPASNNNNKFWGAAANHLQPPPSTRPFKATSPGVLGATASNKQQQQQQHEDYKSSILYCGGKEGSLKHRILNTRSPEPITQNQNSKHVFTFPNLSSTPVHAHAQSNGAHLKHEYFQGSGSHHVNNNNNNNNSNNTPWNFSMADNAHSVKKSPTAPPPSPPTPFKYLSQVYKPSTNNEPSTSTITSTSTNNSPAHLNSPKQNSSTPMQSPKTPTLATATGSPKKPSSGPPTPVLPSNGMSVNGNGNGIVAKSSSSSLSTEREPVPVEQMPKLNAFQCGSLIQLATGDVRAVEDLKVEDFVRSAAKETDTLRIIHCTVISIQGIDMNGAQPLCKVTLAMGTQKQQIVVDTKPEQPFFIPGRGWSSWSPHKTQKVLQLPCTPLAVGDVCITLSKQSKPVPVPLGQPPRSPTVKSKNYSMLSSPKKGQNGVSSRLTVPRNNTDNNPGPRSVKSGGRKVIPKALEVAQAMLPPPCPLTPKTISKISAVVDEKVKVVTSDDTTAAAPSVQRPTTPKKRRWSAPEVLTDEDSGEENKGEDGEVEVIEPPIKIIKTENPLVAPITV